MFPFGFMILSSSLATLHECVLNSNYVLLKTKESLKEMKHWAICLLVFENSFMLFCPFSGKKDKGNWLFQLAKSLFCSNKIRCPGCCISKVAKQVCWWSS